MSRKRWRTSIKPQARALAQRGRTVKLRLVRDRLTQKTTAKRRREFLTEARELADMASEGGYVIVAWEQDCNRQLTRWGVGNTLPVLMMPDHVASVLRYSITQDQIEKVVDSESSSDEGA